jgi:hypothetical protein
VEEAPRLACLQKSLSVLVPYSTTFYYIMPYILFPECFVLSCAQIISLHLQAFYLTPNEELQRWVMTHPEYTRQQVLLLAGCIADFRGIRWKQRGNFLALVASWLET